MKNKYLKLGSQTELKYKELFIKNKNKILTTRIIKNNYN